MLSRDLPTAAIRAASHIASCSSLGLVLGINGNDEIIFVRALPNSPASQLPADELLKNDILVAVDHL